MHLILLSVLCSVLVSVLLKIAPRRRLDVSQMVTWNYLIAAVLCALLMRPDLSSLRGGGSHWWVLVALGGPSLVAGLLLGLFNFGNIVFYVRAHQALLDSPAVLFAAMNIGVVVVGTLVGVVAFKEKTSWWNRAAIVLAIVAIALIAYAPQGSTA